MHLEDNKGSCYEEHLWPTACLRGHRRLDHTPTHCGFMRTGCVSPDSWGALCLLCFDLLPGELFRCEVRHSVNDSRLQVPVNRSSSASRILFKGKGGIAPACSLVPRSRFSSCEPRA